MDTLGKIFGSKARVKIMRLFLFNESLVFDLDDVEYRSLVKRDEVRKELSSLEKIGFLKRKSFSKKTTLASGKTKKKQIKGWALNKKFDLIRPLTSLLIDSELIKEQDLIKRFKKTGKIQYLVLSGVFLQDEDQKIDILVVGESLKRELIDKEIHNIEAEIGVELAYAVFERKEFEYRLSMYDKLIRDILEKPHRALINLLDF